MFKILSVGALAIMSASLGAWILFESQQAYNNVQTFALVAIAFAQVHNSLKE